MFHHRVKIVRKVRSTSAGQTGDITNNLTNNLTTTPHTTSAAARFREGVESARFDDCSMKALEPVAIAGGTPSLPRLHPYGFRRCLFKPPMTRRRCLLAREGLLQPSALSSPPQLRFASGWDSTSSSSPHSHSIVSRHHQAHDSGTLASLDFRLTCLFDSL